MVPMGPSWMYVKDIVAGVIVMAVCIGFVAMQSRIQAAEFRAHVAEELLEKSQDRLVNQEVAN
ncbi:hypothetical protein UFOVP657_4 [uncultured Caudovirales phage]|uniref:Uncharacterized protein n=1 Tax=uncultured Caudovirales phage TaxID=2100421 RepID=A0A6J5N9A6_9CAUD|nr:hypothetical protein UFOVP467_30 [uncultured Caudovirales phage]CAB4155483.1 hypothetical protein UFOVP657_4 [uncultured Caudovirales phage]